MRKIVGLSIAAALGGLALPALADATMECSIEAASQVEIGSCMSALEAKVNATVETALGLATESALELDSVTGRDVAVPALSASQSAWALYRDKHCEFVGATFGGGSGTGIAITGCRIELGRTRTDTLMRYTQ